MKRETTKKKYIKLIGIPEYLESIYTRMKLQFVETGTESYYLLEGEKVKPEDIDIYCPIIALQKNKIGKGKDMDGRRNWMD